MSRIRYNIAYRHLQDLLGTAADDWFFALSWATHAFQNGRELEASKYFRFPPEAIGSIFACKAPIFPWALETLLNELLVAPKQPLAWPPLPIGFEGIAKAFNLLTSVENAAHQLLPVSARGVAGLARISQRQFEWQRGDISLPQLYRGGLLYGGDLYAQGFEQRHGLSLHDFTLSCFMFFLLAQKQPFFGVPNEVPKLGLKRDVMIKAMNLITMPAAQAREQAQALREGHDQYEPSYRPSLLRQYPCVRFDQFVSAPLPALIIRRSTSGLFYDLVGAAGGIRNEVAAKFELYCAQLTSSMLPSVSVLQEFKYRLHGKDWASPDYLLTEGDLVRVVAECKATRMTVPARFAAKPHIDDAKGYAELARGIVQIWRFAAHCRQGGTRNLKRADAMVGLLTTLDSWLIMAGSVADEVHKAAHSMADEDAAIENGDRVPVHFVSIEDLELLLVKSTEGQFFETLRAAARPGVPQLAPSKCTAGDRPSAQTTTQLHPQAFNQRSHPLVGRDREIERLGFAAFRDLARRGIRSARPQRGRWIRDAVRVATRRAD